MPISAENRKRYPPPKVWRWIRERIKKRAGDKCEECAVPNGVYRISSGPHRDEWTRDLMQVETWTCVDGEKVSKIVCTVSHTNHNIEDCSDENLRYLCQRCHLRHDATHHAQNAYRTRKKGKALEMFP